MEIDNELSTLDGNFDKTITSLKKASITGIGTI
jgi:hypothetical protein